jgi:acyl-homoserine lactone acylase PvdQ
VESLVSTHGTWQVPWGAINRVGRGDRTFPLSGVASTGLTTLRAVGGTLDPKTGTLVCQDGQSCTTLVLFKPGRVESYSVTPWGESDHPTSPHYLDQAEKLFGKKILKPTWFQREDLLKGSNVESTTTLEWSGPGK